MELKQRMYSLVIYQLSGIQAGIQAGHATEEFIEKYSGIPELKFRKKDKTVILLNGGITNCDINNLGTINKAYNYLVSIGVNVAAFYEPDLNYALTAISFLVDERVYDKEKYPEVNKKEYNINNIDDYVFYYTSIDSIRCENNKLTPLDEKAARLRYFLTDYRLASN